MAQPLKRIVPAFVFFQDMFVRLMLELLRRKFWFQMRSQESHAVELVGIQAQSHPDQVQMIRHEAIGRTEESFAGGGVQEQFAKRGVKRLVEAALPALRDGKRPMHHRVALIIFAGKTRQIKRPVEIGFHDVYVAAEVTRLKLKIWPSRTRSSRREEAQIKTGNQCEPLYLGCYEI